MEPGINPSRALFIAVFPLNDTATSLKTGQQLVRSEICWMVS